MKRLILAATLLAATPALADGTITADDAKAALTVLSRATIQTTEAERFVALQHKLEAIASGAPVTPLPPPPQRSGKTATP